MYANKNIRWFIKYFMQCRIFYAVKCCFNLLRMRSQIGLAPSAPPARVRVRNRAVPSSGSTRGTQDHYSVGCIGTRGAKQQRERDLSRSCLGGYLII